MTPRGEGFLLLLDAARTFVKRVEDGEVRSVRTYNQLKDALDLIDTPPPEETHCCEGSRRFGECIHA